VFARAIGLVGHLLEEMRRPMGRAIAAEIEREATAHLRGGPPA
jgi:citrate synthase